jgi:hypothetical protein
VMTPSSLTVTEDRFKDELSASSNGGKCVVFVGSLISPALSKTSRLYFSFGISVNARRSSVLGDAAAYSIQTGEGKRSLKKASAPCFLRVTQ